jgi:hypothetical protein
VAEEHLTLGRAALYDWSNEKTLERMFMYERRIENSLYRTIAKLRAAQMLRELQRADAEEQRCAQAQEEINLKKQSQSAGPQWLTDLFQGEPAPDPRSVIAYIKDTYGDNPPPAIQARLSDLEACVAAGSASPEAPKPTSGPRSQLSGRKKDIPLRLLQL